MGVDDAREVGAGFQDLEVDRPLDVARVIAREYLAVEADQDHVLGGDLVEAEG